MHKRVKVWINPIAPGSYEINARQFKMTTILERFTTMVPYFMTFNFQVLCTLSENIGPGRASLMLLCPTPIIIIIKIQDVGYAAVTG